jgi:hypothetical protein
VRADSKWWGVVKACLCASSRCYACPTVGKFNNAACFALLDRVVDSTAAGGNQRVLMYDTRQFVRQTSSFPPGHETLERWVVMLALLWCACCVVYTGRTGAESACRRDKH